MAPKKTVAKKVSVRSEERPPSPPLRLYRRIAFGFVALAVILLITVVYLSAVGAVILITPTTQIVKTDFLLDGVRAPTEANQVRSQVVQGSLSRTATYQPSGTGTKDVVGIAKGTVTLYDNSSTPQTLVKTTRMLAPDGTLFRLSAAATVPANGTVSAAVYADQPGASGDIAASRFIIPGLDAARQVQIYAVSTQTFIGGDSQVGVIAQSDIDQAEQDLKPKIATDEETALHQQADASLAGAAYDVEVVSQSASVVAGTQASSFTVTMNVQVTAVFFDQTAVQDAATQNLFQALPTGQRFAEVDAAGLQVTVDKADVASDLASLHIYMDGRAVPSASSPDLDPARFAGLTAAQIKQMLVAAGIATDVQVKFTPPFLTKVPALKDHITVELVQ